MEKFFRVICTVDQNDADYNTKVSKMSEKDIPMLRDLADRISKFEPYEAYSECVKRSWTHTHNYPTFNNVREDLGEKFPKEVYNLTDEEEDFINEITPYGESGFHTIVSIEILPYVESEKLMQKEY